MKAHKTTVEVYRYAVSDFAYKVVATCKCGKKVTLTDGRTAPTRARAKAALKKKHV